MCITAPFRGRFALVHWWFSSLEATVFIDFEGPDKCGKSSIIWLMARANILQCSKPVVFGQEPTDMPIGMHIRKILERKYPAPENPRDLQRMFVLDRAQDVVCNIEPALREEKVVLYDRYALSTLAYGISAVPPDRMGAMAEDLLNLHREVLGPFMVWPDVTYLIMITPQEAIRRLQAEGGTPQLFERREKLERIVAAYRWLYVHWSDLRLPGECVVIDGMSPRAGVGSRILQDLRPRLP